MDTHTFFLHLVIILLTARIFAELGRTNGIFDNDIYAALVLVIALTTLLPPFVMKWFYNRTGDAGSSRSRRRTHKLAHGIPHHGTQPR